MANANEEQPTLLEFINGPVTFANWYSFTHNGQKKYKYYDTPDGQDIDKKLLVTGKYGLAMGSLFALFDIRLYSNPKTVFDTINRCAWYIVPITGMWTTYAAITYTATNLSGVDSPWNGGIGGAAAGGLLGVWLKNYRLGILTALYTGLACTMAKDAHMLGLELFDVNNLAREIGDIRTRSRDYSCIPIGEKGWTTA